jgi:hypothetical protein
MRLTTGTAALAVAGLAALATGCSSSSPAAQAPVVHHAPAVVKPAAVTTAPQTPQQQLARAMRTTLGMHTALFRVRWSISYVTPPAKNENINPYQTVAGVADFDNNRWVQHVVLADHAAQPSFPDATGMSDGDNVFTGSTTSLVNNGVWTKSALQSCNNADSLADVLSFTTGRIAVKKYVRLYGETGYTRYTAKVDFGRQLKDSCSADDRALGSKLVGQLVTEIVWVNRDGEIVLKQIVLDPGAVQVPGVSASQVKAIYRTVELGSFGVSPVIPPHRTS